MMPLRTRTPSLRARLLLSACALAVPGVGQAQVDRSQTTGCTTTATSCSVGSNGSTGNGTVGATDDRQFNLDQQDTLTVAPTGRIAPTTNQAVSIAAGTGGVTVTNNGIIEALVATADGRGINSSIDAADRSVTINNITTGTTNARISGSADGIRFAAATATTAATGTIRITNNGIIEGTGVRSGQGIEATILGSTLDITNRAGGTISGSQGILSLAATTNIVNAGTITGTAAIATQGEAIRTNIILVGTTTVGSNLTLTNTGTITGVYGVIGTGAINTITNGAGGTISGSNATTATASQSREGIRVQAGLATGATVGFDQVNTVNLLSGSTTTAGTGTGATGNAIAFGGTVPAGNTMTNTLNIEVGAVINGNITGSGNAASTNTLNLRGAGAQTLVPITNFDQINVQGGNWTVANRFVNGSIAAGTTLQFNGDVQTSGLTGALVNNGTLIYNLAPGATSESLSQAGAISGSGGVQLTGTGTIVLGAPATYSGATVISAGRLRTGALANAFSANSAVTVGADGILDLNDGTLGRDQTIANLSGAGLVRLGNATSAATLTTGGGGGDTTFSGQFNQSGNLTKVGAGTLTLAGASTASGLLTVQAGGVALSTATGRWNGAATLADGTNLTGAGRITGVLTVGAATIAPGDAGIGTLTTGGLVLSAGSILDFQFGAPGTGDRIQVNGNLTLDGTLNVTSVGGFGEGVYRLITYTGSLVNNGLEIGAVPAGENRGLMTIQTSVATQVNLVYGTPIPTTIQFWDGADDGTNAGVDGGSGSWTNSAPNWTNANGTDNTAWAGAFGVFQGAAGTVTVDDAIAFTGAQFITDGYVIAAGTGTLSAVAALTNIRVDPGVTATIGAGIGGTGGVLKNDAGTLVLGGANSYAGATNILGGTVQVTGGSAIPLTSLVNVAAAGTLQLLSDQGIGDLTGAGTVALSGGSLTTGALGGTVSFTGTIGGSGGLTKTGAGTTTLGGANGYTGTTNVAQGTLALASGGALGSGALAVAGGATLNLAGQAATVGALSGAGTVAIGTGGTLTSNAATDSAFGGTLTGGRLVKAGAGALTLSGGANTIAALDVNGGRLVAATAGALNTAAVATIGAAGALELGASQTVAALNGAGAVALNANRLTVAGAGDSAFTGVASGAGGLTKVGAGTLTLAGANSYLGATEVSGGTLSLTGSVAGPVTIATGGTLAGNGNAGGIVTVGAGMLAPGGAGAGTLTVGGLVLSAGSVLEYGLGAPTVAAASDRIQVNGNLVLDGTLNVTDLGGFGAGVYRLIDYTGTLVDNGLDVGVLPTNATRGRTQVQTAVATQVNLVVGESLPEIQFWDGAGTTPNGRVDGGSGSWTNGRTAWTNANGTANTEWGGRFAVFQGAAGTVTVDAAIEFSGMQFMTDGYVIAAGTGALNAVEAQTNLRVDPGVTATIGAAIGGAGGLNKLDTGTLILTGANSYAGETVVAGGTLRAGATGALPGGTAVTVASGAALDVAAAQTIASLTGAGSVTLSGGGLTVGGAGGGAGGDSRFAGVISGSGGLTKAGNGTFTLAGANSYTGGTTINAGTLRLDGGTVGGGALTVATGATFDVNGGSAAVGTLSGGGSILLGTGTLSAGGAASSTFGGVISGTGSFAKTGTGTLTLTGVNTYTGTTSVRAGTLAIGTGTLPTAAAVAIDTGATLALTGATTLGTLNGAGSVALGANTLSVAGGAYAGAIGGTGGLTKTGTGLLTLTGASTYTGATAINAGTLAIGAGGSIAGSSSVTLANTARLDIAAASAQTVNGLNGVAGTSVVLGANRLTVNNAAANTFAGVFSGTGSVVKSGAGTLTLSGANTHSGGTGVTGGVLAAGATNAFGPGTLTVTAPGSATLATFNQTVGGIAGDGAISLGSATLTVTGSATTSYGGVLSGTGGLTKTGTGTQTLTGASTYTGPTSITGGLLAVNGSLASIVTVSSTGRLGGTGTVGGLSVSGTVAPGNSIGTLNVAGSLTFAAGSTYQVEVAPNGTSDRIAATGAVTIQGGTVAVLTAGQSGFSGLTTYTILTGGSIAGTFAGTTSDAAFLTPTLVYNATNVQLRLVRNDVAFGAIAETENQLTVAGAITARNSGTIFDRVVVLNAADARVAFDQLSGEVYTAGPKLAGRDGHAAGRAMLDRIDSATGDGVQLWIQGGLGATRADARDGFARIKSERQSLAGGVEFANAGTRGGVAYRHATSDIDVRGRGDADLTTDAAFAYMGHDTGSLRFAAGVGVAWHTLSTARSIAFTGFTDRTTSSEKGQSYVGFGELAYLAPLGGLRAGPYAGVSIVATTLDGTVETGGAAALTVDKVKKTTTAAGYGVRGTGTAGGVTFIADIGGRTFLNDELDARRVTFNSSGGSFLVGANDLARTALTGRLDASIVAGPAVLGLGLRAETAKDNTSYGVRVSAGIRF